MEGQTRAVSDNSGLISAQPISVLVVDDDTTCLAIVAAKLRKFQYHVTTVKHPNEALCTLRVNVDAFDLVVADVHMPDLSGIQLQQVIAREFNLPVVLMSADKKKDVVVEGLESGAAFYIAKPLSTDDLKDLWQFAVTKTKKSQVVIEETGSLTHEIMTSSNKTSNSDAVGGAESSMIEIAGSTSVDEIIHDYNRDSKRKSPQKEKSSGKGRENSETASQKKQKVFWTNSLHNRFLEAIKSIGFDRAVPKKIIEVMNVPSLTKENVASHLQKYRIFLRRVTEEANLKLQCSEKLSSNMTFSPKFTTLSRSSSSSLSLNSLTRMHNSIPQTFLGAKNAFFLNREGSSRDILGQSGFGQWRLLSNGGSRLNPKVVGTNRTTETRLVQNFYQNITLVQGNIFGAFSPHFNPLILDSTPGVNLEIADYGFSYSYINDGIINLNFNSLSSTTSKDCAIQTNFVGLNISIVQQLLAKSARKQRACDGRINNFATGLEFQNSTTAGIVLRPNESPATNVDQMAGDQLFGDFLAEECQMLMHSNVYKVMGNVENGLGESSYDHSATYNYSPMFDSDELTSLPLDQECNLNPNILTSIDQVVNLQNQVQGFDNVSCFDQVVNVQNQVQNFDNVPSFNQVVNVQNQGFDNVSSFDQVVNVQNQVQDFDNVPPFDQTLNEPDDDAFMEFLLAPGLGLFEENYNIEGL